MATKHFQVALDILQDAAAVPATSYDSWAEYYDLTDADRAPFVAFGTATSTVRPSMPSPRSGWWFVV